MVRRLNLALGILMMFLLSFTPALSHNVTVKFWLDKGMTVPYIDEFMTVYLQNKTYQQGRLDYDKYCFASNYTGGQALITTNQTSTSTS
jgi:hypothetical protein